MVQHFEILLEFLGDLVNEDALGVDVLGPRLAVDGHLHLRKTQIDSNSVKQRLFCRMFSISLNWIGASTFSPLNMAAALERSRVRLLRILH